MVYRPRDICSAAFFDDVRRLRLLAYQDAPGGLEYRFNWESFLTAVTRANQTTPAGNSQDDGEAPEGFDDADEEVEFEEALEAALEADEELQRLRKLYTLEEEEIDDEDAAAAEEESAETGGARDEDGLYNPEVIDADMAAQETDFNRFKRLLRHRQREKAVAAALQRYGFLISGESPVELETFGLMFAAKERACAPALADAEEGSHVTPLAVRWLPDKKSPYMASPLHWAILGRAHDAVRFLVANGVDTSSEVGQDKASVVGGSAFHFPTGLTARRVAEMNDSAQTLAVLEAAEAARAEFLRAVERAKQQIEGSLERRKARQEKRRLGREQRRVAREERNAAAEEEEEDMADGEEDGMRNDEGDETDNDGDY